MDACPSNALRRAGRTYLPRDIIDILLRDAAFYGASGVDLIMMDVKIADPEKHREYTGASNDLIMENPRPSCPGAPLGASAQGSPHSRIHGHRGEPRNDSVALPSVRNREV